MKNLKEIQVLDSYTVRMLLNEPDSLFLEGIIGGDPIAGWVIGAPKYIEQVGLNFVVSIKTALFIN